MTCLCYSVESVNRKQFTCNGVVCIVLNYSIASERCRPVKLLHCILMFLRFRLVIGICKIWLTGNHWSSPKEVLSDWSVFVPNCTGMGRARSTATRVRLGKF